MAIDYPLWFQLKENIKALLEAVAVEENAVSPARNFRVEKDMWRPSIESESNIPLVNIMVSTVGKDEERSSARVDSLDEIAITIDMYVLGEGGDVLPADELAAKRLDLLCAQVRTGLRRLASSDFGFSKDPDYGFPIDWSRNFNLTYYDQETEQATGQYAPARWNFSVWMPFIPEDDNEYVDLEEINVTVKDEDIELFAAKFLYENP